MRFSCVIFDCDGVLVDSERLVNDIESRFVSDLGWPLSPDEARALFKGRTFAQMAGEIERQSSGCLPAEWQYELGFATAHGLMVGLRAVPGVSEVVSLLQARGVKLAVASQSAPARVALSLAVCGLRAHFGEHVYTASMVARPKPAPDLYLHAASMLEAQAHACAVVEDSASGVQAGIAAGMTVFGYAGDEDESALARAGAIVFHRMEQLPELLGAGFPAPARQR